MPPLEGSRTPQLCSNGTFWYSCFEKDTAFCLNVSCPEDPISNCTYGCVTPEQCTNLYETCLDQPSLYSQYCFPVETETETWYQMTFFSAGGKQSSSAHCDPPKSTKLCTKRRCKRG